MFNTRRDTAQTHRCLVGLVTVYYGRNLFHMCRVHATSLIKTFLNEVNSIENVNDMNLIHAQMNLIFLIQYNIISYRKNVYLRVRAYL